jgi:serine/threonine protein kinase
MTCSNYFQHSIAISPGSTTYPMSHRVTKKTFLSSGSYSVVYHAAFEDMELALKKTFAELHNEIKVMCLLQGKPNIVQIYDWGLYNHILMIGMELATGTICEYPNKDDVHKRLKIVGSLILAVVELHNINFVHRDLKWENVFYFGQNLDYVKLGDFGLAEKLSENGLVCDKKGTIYNMAPEVKRLNKGECYFGKPADIFSLGKMITEMLRGYDGFEFFNLIDENCMNRPNAYQVWKTFQRYESNLRTKLLANT